MTYESKIKAVAAGVTATLFASLITIGVMYRNNSLLSEDVKAEKVRTETLSSEKTSLKKEIEKLKLELSSFDTQNRELQNAIRTAQYQLAEKESQVNKLTKETSTIPGLKKELDAIRKIRKDLIAQLEDLKKNNSQLEAEVSELNRTIAALRKENESLYAKMGEKQMMAYNFRVEPVKKRKDKLTARAKRTNKVNISFDVNSPKNLGSKVYVKISSDKEGELEGESLIAMEMAEELQEDELYASTEAYIISTDEYKRLSVTFDPKEKLSEGVYYVKVFNGNDYLGSTQFKLRK